METYTGLRAKPIKLRIRKHESDIYSYKPHDSDNHKSGRRLGMIMNDGTDRARKTILDFFNIPSTLVVNIYTICKY